MYAQFFFAAKIALGDATQRLLANAVKRCVVALHEFCDMDEMPNSQALLRFVAIASRSRCDAAASRARARSWCRGKPCCDALAAAAYTFP
jgi:hypothetical protein